MNGFEAGLAFAYQWGSAGLELAVVAAGYAALLAVAVALVNVLFRRWLSAGQLGLLWGLVLVRLMLPIAPESSLSLQNLSRAVPAVEAATPPAVSASAAVLDTLDPPSYSAEWQPPTPSLAEQAGDLFLALLPLVWLAGAVAVVCWTMIVNWRFSRRARRTPVCRDERLLRLWAGCCRQAGVGSSIGVLQFDGVEQPAVMGLFRPRLLLPSTATDLDDEQLRMVMLHELAHVRRCDIAVNWLLVVVRAAHWWNPIYWLAAARFVSLREQACDAFVLQRLDSSSSRGYSELLLLLAERGPSGGRWRVMLPVSILGFLSSFFRRRAVRNRLRALRTAGRVRGPWQTVAGALTIALAAGAGLTDAKVPAPPAESTDWLPAATVDRAAWPVVERETGPDETRVYVIDKVLERIAADGGTLEYAWMQIEPLVGNLLRWQSNLNTVPFNTSGPNPTFTDFVATVSDRPRDRYTFEGGQLTVRAPREVHEELAGNLAAWEQAGLGQISVWCRFISGLPTSVAPELGLTWRYHNATSQAVGEPELIADSHNTTPVVRASAVVNDYFPVAVATLDSAKTKRLVDAAESNRRTNVLYAPKITLFSGQRAHLNDYSQTPFVVGVREVTPGVQEPNIVVVDDGTKVAMRATHTADRSRVRLAARVELSHIGEVRTAALTLGAEMGAIQLPRVRRCSIDVASEVKSGDSVLIGCMSSYEDKRFMYVLLTVQDVTEAARAAK